MCSLHCVGIVSIPHGCLLNVEICFQENKKTGPIKQQLEMYKRQMHELQTKLSEETKRADKGEFENKRWQEKMATLQKEKEVALLNCFC